MCAISVDFLIVFVQLIRTHIVFKCLLNAQIKSRNKRVRVQFLNFMLTCIREKIVNKKKKEKIRNKLNKMT